MGKERKKKDSEKETKGEDQETKGPESRVLDEEQLTQTYEEELEVGEKGGSGGGVPGPSASESSRVKISPKKTIAKKSKPSKPADEGGRSSSVKFREKNPDVRVTSEAQFSEKSRDPTIPWGHTILVHNGYVISTVMKEYGFMYNPKTKLWSYKVKCKRDWNKVFAYLRSIEPFLSDERDEWLTTNWAVHINLFSDTEKGDFIHMWGRTYDHRAVIGNHGGTFKEDRSWDGLNQSVMPAVLPIFAREGYNLVGTFNFDGRFNALFAAYGYAEVEQNGEDELYRLEHDVYVPPGAEEGEESVSSSRTSQIDCNSPA
eukprot:155566-Rhodomonas_salina.2